jgi:hypothetical protein
MKANKVIPILILTVGGIMLLWSLMVSPYKYEWEPILRQRDDDAIDVLRVFYPFLLIVFTGGFLMARLNSKTWVKCAYIAALVMVFYKLLEVFSV